MKTHAPTDIPEGVTRFSVAHRTQTLEPSRYGQIAAELIGWRTVLAKVGLIGQSVDRYDGAGFGNVSSRTGPFPGRRGRRPFLITGTQTGGASCISLSELALVTEYDWRKNWVMSRGDVRPSSEAMTHAAVYDLGAHIRFVFHVHSPEIWHSSRSLGLPMSDPNVAYGTPEMALEIQRLARDGRIWNQGILAMGGHLDGVISFGRTAAEAGCTLIKTQAKAYALGLT